MGKCLHFTKLGSTHIGICYISPQNFMIKVLLNFLCIIIILCWEMFRHDAFLLFLNFIKIFRYFYNYFNNEVRTNNVILIS